MRQHLARSLLCATIACVALVSSCHHTHPELGKDPVVPDRDLPYANVNWMRLIPDDRYLSEITIPGAHDCGADLHSSQQGTESEVTICQNFRIWNQLSLGVRWFDVRLHCSDGALTVFHGPYYLHKNFGDDVLHVVLSFLEEHPTEAVVLMIQQEHSSVSDHQFQQAVMDHIGSRGAWRFYIKNRVPKMGEVRGKVVLVRQYGNEMNLSDCGMMFRWSKNTTGGYFENDGTSIYVQDHYSLVTVPYSEKIDQVKDCISKAHADQNRQRFYLNFVSGEEAPLTRLQYTASQIQPAVETWLCAPTIYRKCGIVMVNFAGGSDDGEVEKWLVDDLVDCNDLEVSFGGASPQTWKAYNLDATHYRNGDPIPFCPDPIAWSLHTTGAWCWYADFTGGTGHYGVERVAGKLYNWYAVNDPRGLAPQGWRVASADDWTTLVSKAGGWNMAGYTLRSADYWMPPGPDPTGFRSRPGGWRQAGGHFEWFGSGGKWWTSTDSGGTHAVAMGIYTDQLGVEQLNADKRCGYSVRIIKE